jgi:hypothetical protein
MMCQFSFTPDQILDEEWFLPGTYERIRVETRP